MNESATEKTPTERYWSQLFLMLILAAGIFASIEYIPTILDGSIGVIVAVVAASVLLYSFGSVTGGMIAGDPS